MFVVAQHKISDPSGFANAVKKATPNIPSGLTLHQMMPSADGRSSVCLWEGESVDKIRQAVEAVVGQFSQNTYFEVASSGAVGLPGASE
jgi:hypothetical protein